MIYIKVPATTANLGPGFDTLGLALNLYHEISVCQSSNEVNQVHWHHATQMIADEENLVIDGIEAVNAYYNMSPVPFSLEMLNCNVPASRGLGSSAAAYVSGVVAGLYLLNKPLDKQVILEIASRLEGHPDNVAPAVFGGLIASCMTDQQVFCQTIHLQKPIQFVALIPACKLSTQEARSVLPTAYSKADVVYSLARLSLLLTAFQNGAYDLLQHATQDILHQPHRLALMPDAEKLVALSKLEISYGGFVSGAGSTYMLMCAPEHLAAVMAAAAEQLTGSTANWAITPLDLATEGTLWEVHS